MLVVSLTSFFTHISNEYEQYIDAHTKTFIME
ncbi:hypothetical protein J2S08_003946 [Bacillus chungangensis]|uniref:Uncharacterized protein n=1 Tax=Bacillus chungangensis TaxID=587633 RepID=A0ABT9WYW4_9BACI|nr:hypothetical protein [Bacillus chungangensis]